MTRSSARLCRLLFVSVVCLRSTHNYDGNDDYAENVNRAKIKFGGTWKTEILEHDTT